MSVPSLTISQDSSSDERVVTIIGAASTPEGIVLNCLPEFEALLQVARSLEVSTATDSVTRIPHPDSTKAAIAVIGLGALPVAPNALREAAGAALRRLAGNPAVEFALAVNSDAELAALAEGALLGAYSFTRYRHTSLEGTKISVTSVHIRTTGHVSDAAKQRVHEKALAISLVKDLVNMPAQDLFPESFADTVTELCSPDSALSVTVWDEKKLAKDGFGGILGVGRGSERPPRLVRIEYAPATASTHIALVGKGITFDTGGLSLKTGSGMMGMKYDMTGAATAFAVVRAISALRVNVRVSAWLCLAENMPSGHATRPNDILTIRGGTTVEVLNTDAEGRLVLADGLVAASETHPDLIIDIATLTGAATTALGTRTVGVMGNTEEISHLVEVARTSGETFWHMPLPSELRPLLNSEIADIANVKPGNTAAGMLIAGVFLRDFVGKTNVADGTSSEQLPWIHLDIAGTANNAGSAYGFTNPGPTGVTVRALIDYISARA